MKICYYPGCTLKTQAKDLDKYARDCAAVLGVEMEEPEAWQCCGAVYPTARDEIATKLSAVRTLDYAKTHGGRLLTLCSACHNVMKRVNDDMRHDDQYPQQSQQLSATRSAITAAKPKWSLPRNALRRRRLRQYREKVVKPIGRKVGAYYGCLLLRPGKVMAFDNPENPTIMEDLLKSIGAEPVKYPMRNECCGAYTSFKDKELTGKRVRMIIDSALASGAEEIVTACRCACTT